MKQINQVRCDIETSKPEWPSFQNRSQGAEH